MLIPQILHQTYNTLKKLESLLYFTKNRKHKLKLKLNLSGLPWCRIINKRAIADSWTSTAGDTSWCHGCCVPTFPLSCSVSCGWGCLKNADLCVQRVIWKKVKVWLTLAILDYGFHPFLYNLFNLGETQRRTIPRIFSFFSRKFGSLAPSQPAGMPLAA